MKFKPHFFSAIFSCKTPVGPRWEKTWVMSGILQVKPWHRGLWLAFTSLGEAKHNGTTSCDIYTIYGGKLPILQGRVGIYIRVGDVQNTNILGSVFFLSNMFSWVLQKKKKKKKLLRGFSETASVILQGPILWDYDLLHACMHACWISLALLLWMGQWMCQLNNEGDLTCWILLKPLTHVTILCLSRSGR